MSSVDLVFDRVPIAGNPVNLVFGEEEVTIFEGTLAGTLPGLSLAALVAEPNDATLVGTLPGLTLAAEGNLANDASLTGQLPALTFAAVGEVFSGLVFEGELGGVMPGLTLSALVAEPNDATAAVGLPGLSMAFEVEFDSNVSRPLVGQVTHQHQQGVRTVSGLTDLVRRGLVARVGVENTIQQALKTQTGVTSLSADADRLRSSTSARSSTADRLRASTSSSHSEMLRDRRPSISTGSSTADPRRAGARTSHQERFRDRRPRIEHRHQTGQPLRRTVQSSHQIALPFHLGRAVRHQEAMRPPAGMYVPPIPPGPEPCYDPDPNLVFNLLGPATSHLLFICDNHVEPPGPVVVPIKKVYIVLNDVYLKRVDGNLMLPATSLSLSADADSWTWAFSASLPISQLDNIVPVAGENVLLEASINGSVYRLLAESISRERQFGSNSIRVSGRGISSVLAAPYAPVMSFDNTAGARTAQQLMGDVLSINGIPLGWDLDWNLTDWLVPAGAFSAQGSHMDAVNQIAAAAGGYVQSHPTLQELLILPRYPDAPWAWASVTPDFEIPSAVMTREGIEWRDKALYNRVWVSGEAQGVLGRVTRAGTDGGLEAPGVVDPLITHVDAARQRGLSILSDTGRQAQVSLSMPVLAETGVIPPGKYVEYTDGSVLRVGLTRAVTVDVSRPTVRQTLTLETHEA